MAHQLTAAAGANDLSEHLASLDQNAIAQMRRELACAFRAAADNNMEEGICNHFSAMLPGSDRLFFVNPYGLAFEEIAPDDLLVCAADGTVVQGDGAPEATAFYIHAAIHLAQPRARVVFHTHMPYATALAISEGAPLAFASQTALKFWDRIALDTDYNGLALDHGEGDRIARAAGDADIVFLRNHGVIVLAPTVAEAWDDLYFLERACEVQCLAQAAGRKPIPVPPELAAKSARQIRSEDPASAAAHMKSLLRRMARRDPVFAE